MENGATASQRAWGGCPTSINERLPSASLSYSFLRCLLLSLPISTSLSSSRTFPLRATKGLDCSFKFPPNRLYFLPTPPSIALVLPKKLSPALSEPAPHPRIRPSQSPTFLSHPEPSAPWNLHLAPPPLSFLKAVVFLLSPQDISRLVTPPNSYVLCSFPNTHHPQTLHSFRNPSSRICLHLVDFFPSLGPLTSSHSLTTAPTPHHQTSSAMCPPQMLSPQASFPWSHLIAPKKLHPSNLTPSPRLCHTPTASPSPPPHTPRPPKLLQPPP